MFSDTSSGWFDGQQCEIERGNYGNPTRIDIFYGGLLYPSGAGHGHVVSEDGENIHFWRTPDYEGGLVKVDSSWSYERLSSHGF